MFLKAIDCSNEIKDKDFIAKHMREVIMEVGHSNIVQIVMDNAAVCKAVGLIIEAEFSFHLLDSMCYPYIKSCFEEHMCNQEYRKKTMLFMKNVLGLPKLRMMQCL